MSRNKLVLTPVGASIASRLEAEEKDIWRRVCAQKELDKIERGQFREQQQLERRVAGRLGSLDLTTEAGLRFASPEIKSLAKIGVGPDDRVVLYASETADGILTARVVQAFTKETWHCSAEMRVIPGLQVESPGRFRGRGVPGFVREVVKEIDTNRYRYDEVKLNATAGYKSLAPYTTLIGLLFEIPVVYIFETSEELLTLPPMPIALDNELVRRFLPLLEKIERETSVSEEEVLRNVSVGDRDRLLPLLEPFNGEYSLSALGILMYERYKSPPRLQRSATPPNEKDCTRDWSQEPHRSRLFEEFKDRLAQCPWVNKFWYLQGTNIARKEVKRVGSDLHVAFAGIELCVQVTATYDAHYDVIKADIERLMR